MNNILPEHYFTDAFHSYKNKDVEECIGCMDIAISLSDNKAFYIYQKIKMLYGLNQYEDCTAMLASNLKLLYTYCSLFTFSQILYYYVQASKDTENVLINLLLSNNIPRSLATEYPLVLKNQSHDFSIAASQAKENNEWALALEYCLLALKESPYTISLLELKATCHHNLNQLSACAKTYENILLLNPNHATAIYQLGICFTRQNLLEEATPYFENALKLDPDNLTYLKNISKHYIQLKLYSKAIEVLEYLIGKYPTEIEAYLLLSETYKTNKQPKLAKHYAKLVKKIG